MPLIIPSLILKTNHCAYVALLHAVCRYHPESTGCKRIFVKVNSATALSTQTLHRHWTSYDPLPRTKHAGLCRGTCFSRTHHEIAIMRDKKSPRGNLFNFTPRTEWRNEIAQQVHLSGLYRSHMVLVLGKALDRPPGWVRIVTVSSHSPPS